MTDNRAGTSIDKHIGALLSGGFKEFLNFVKTHDDLEIAFRGNSNKVTIYYHNHMMWDLSFSRGNKLKVTVSFNHARYCADWLTKFDDLKNEGFDVSKCVINTIPVRIGNLSCLANSFSVDFVTKTYNVMKDAIDTYFTWSRKHDYFKNTDANRKVNLVEKVAQQEIYRYFKNGVEISKDKYLCLYDLEFAQKNAPEGNKPDFLGIIYNKGFIEQVVMVEVKSLKGALGGSSGIRNHYKGMKNYNSNPVNVIARIVEAKEYLAKLHKLGLRESWVKNGLTNAIIANLPQTVAGTIGNVIFLTDEVCECYKWRKSSHRKSLYRKGRCPIILFYYDYESALRKGKSGYSWFSIY
ncbi:hypothetical protein [Phascolarctobacterium sp.]|uniref:hypothetical protein n=1 Tax=Phascolarctobacterium sp. TaxID=2049039 RepID=UPI00386991B6